MTTESGDILLQTHRWIVGRGKKSKSETLISVKAYDSAVNILVEMYKDRCRREEIVRHPPTELKPYKDFGFEPGTIKRRYFIHDGFIVLKLPNSEDPLRYISTHHLTLCDVHSLAGLLNLPTD